MKRTLQYTFMISLSIFIASISNSPVSAQAQNKQLSVEDDEQGELKPNELVDFKKEVTKKMRELESYLMIIGDKDKPDDERDMAIKLAVELFAEGSLMQVSSLNTGKINTYPMLQYFHRLKDLDGYTKVRITFYDVLKVDEFKAFNASRYTSTATYYQHFEGIRNNKIIYQDRTKKKVAINLEKREDAFYKAKGWMVLLGNVTAESTFTPPKL